MIPVMPAVADRIDPFAALLGSVRGQEQRDLDTIITFNPLIPPALFALTAPGYCVAREAVSSSLLATERPAEWRARFCECS